MTKINWPIRARDLDLRIRNVIDGRYVENQNETQAMPVQNNLPSDNQVITKHSPRDGRLLYTLAAGTEADINQAVANAKDSFEDGRWRKRPVGERKAILEKLADLVEANREELALYESLDVGKPISKALQQDIPRTIATLRHNAEGATQLLSSAGMDGTTFAYQLRKPVGVVGAIIGWNFPLRLASSKVGPALAMGNSLVLKPSEYSSLSASRLAALALEAGVPPGVFNVVHGAGTTVGVALAHHPDINLLTFTGSSATGKQIMIAAGQSNMKRLMLECGGKSPYLVFDDCPDDLDAIAADIVATAFPNQGALCVAGSRVLIQDSIKDKLLPKILEQAAKITPQDPLNPSTTFGAIINEEHLNKVLAYIESAQQEGAQLLCGGKRVHVDIQDSEGGESAGSYIEPTIFDQVKPQQTIAQEEIFGPVLCVFTFKDEAEAVALANNTCFGLAAYVATENLSRAHRLVQTLDAGAVIVIGTSGSPSGGINIGAEGHKESGFGFEGGIDGLASYTVTTSAHMLI